MTQITLAPTLPFNDGRSIPQLGLGVWQVADDVAAQCVQTAIEAGYRHVDTAAIYENERGVGDGIHASGVERDELFVTTKLWNSEQGFDATMRAFNTSCELLRLDEIDLYLIHWPAPINGERYVESWRAMVELRASGRARSVGVSNFHAPHLERLIEETGTVPVINQVELHPYFQQQELRALHAAHGIVTESWSPLGQGGELLADRVIVEIAEAHGVMPAQVVIRWHIEHGLVTIPKSQHAERIRANFDVFGFELSSGELERIDGLDRGPDGRLGPNPETAQF